MFDFLLILGMMKKLGGGGVSLSALENACAENGYPRSRYRLRKILNELKSVGAVGRNKNHWFLRLLGGNIAIADEYSAEGYPVNEWVVYQPELPIFWDVE